MVNIGHTVEGSGSIASAAALTIQPPVGEEWLINNIYVPAAATLAKCDGTNEVEFESAPGATGWLKYTFNLTNNHYLKVYNDDTVDQVIMYDGRRTA